MYNNNNDSHDSGILFSNVNGHEYLLGSIRFYPMKKLATKIKFPWCDPTGQFLVSKTFQSIKS